MTIEEGLVGRSVFKVLCLHGIGTNSEILEAQTALCAGRVVDVLRAAALRYQLGEGYQFDFLDGGHPWPAALGITQAFGERQLCFSYFDGSTESVVEAVDDLAEYVAQNGPFHAVLGFSLGAALAATLLLRDEKLQRQPAFQAAIFLCGILPCSWTQLQQGKFQFLTSKDVAQVIQIPTLHVWSKEDVEYPGQSAQLVHLTNAAQRFEVLHTRGHSVPSQGAELGPVVDAIRILMAATNI